jgi:hypothetical protein
MRVLIPSVLSGVTIGLRQADAARLYPEQSHCFGGIEGE